MSAALPGELADAIRAKRSAAMESLGEGPTLWLAAAPLWTKDAAEATGFPVQSVTDFVRRARAAGWCETRGSLETVGELHFWMPDEARREVIDLLLRQTGRKVQGAARQIATRVMAARSAHPVTTLPATLVDWAELMAERSPEQALVERVVQAIAAEDLSRAQQLILAGEPLAPLLTGIAELAIDRARRLMSLGARRRHDLQALGRYLDRPELSGAVSRLLRPDAEQWVLHLRGVGGVGKTMLIRYLASGRYAADRGLPDFPVARADFDHISADYPVRRPVQLLLELSDELALHTAATERADRALSRFRAVATSAHEALSGVREANAIALQHPLVGRAITEFAKVLESLPGALLILDTCEELAKADAGNPLAPAVRTTLAIIERLHERAPSMRVLLAGRRPLPTRPYLVVKEVTGFTVDEARRYLAEFSSRTLAPGLADAMIRQSTVVDADVPPPGELPSRVSPFDLALYQSWAEEDPDLDPRRVEMGSDAYIEGRIIERLGDPLVRKALPTLASIGRCQVETLAAFVASDDASAAALGTRLAEQEWVDADGDPPLHLMAKPALARRLRHYFSAPERCAEFTAVNTRLADSLVRKIRGQPLAEVDVDELLAALRLAEPADAVTLWDGLTERTMEPPGNWSWMLNVASRVLGESEYEQWPTANALRATVLASYIAASRRASASFNPNGAWLEVRALAERHPDADAARVLRARAAVGLLPYAPDDESLWADLRSAPPDAVLAAAAVDAVDRMLESTNVAVARRLMAEEHMRAALDGEADDLVHAWALVMLGRLRLDEDRPAALNAFAQAEAWAAVAPPEHVWPDWIRPEDLLARVRIERGLIDAPDEAVLEGWEFYAANNLASVDRERLASLCLRIRLDQGTIEQSVIERWEELDRYVPGRAPTCSAHDLVPPLCVTLAEAELIAGRPEQALTVLERRRDEILAAREDHADDATLNALDEEKIRIVRRFRLDDQRHLLTRLANPSSMTSSRFHLRDSARRALAVVHHEQPFTISAESREPESWHAWWQCQTRLPSTLPPMEWSPDSPTDLAGDVYLDLEELRLLGAPKVARDLKRQLADWLARSPQEISSARAADPFRDVRVGLRRAALTGTEFEPRVGVSRRRVAEIAFEEAELLALRLPSAATWLFRQARVDYAKLGHRVGQLMAAASLAAITGDPADREMVWAARGRLRMENPAATRVLAGLAEAAGPWRYWAEFTQRVLAGRIEPVSGTSEAVGPRPIGDYLRAAAPVTRPEGAFPDVEVTHEVEAEHGSPRDEIKRPRPMGLKSNLAAPLVSAGLALTALGITLTTLFGAKIADVGIGPGQAPGPQSGVGQYVWPILGAVLVALTGVLLVRLPKILRLADGRGVGALRLGSLRFTASVRADMPDQSVVAELCVDPRQLRDAPRRHWLRLALTLPFVRLARRLRHGTPSGYVSIYSRADNLTWLDSPKARDRWWHAGADAAAGSIVLSRAQAIQPWERIVSTSLGPAAAGRIEWALVLATGAKPFPDFNTPDVAVDAPATWQSYMYYAPSAEAVVAGDRPHRIRHAIGRAVTTSAGPRLDVSGEAATNSSNTEELLSTEQLVRGEPAIVILQAEPTFDEAGVSPGEDATEWRELAVDLIEARVPAVFILPALSAGLARVVAQTVAEHVVSEQGDDPLILHRQLRRALLGHKVKLLVLDDIVLFVNPRRYS